MSSRMRNGRLKALAGTVVTLSVCGIIFVLNSTQKALDLKSKSLDKLQQEHDSLSAQLQGKSYTKNLTSFKINFKSPQPAVLTCNFSDAWNL